MNESQTGLSINEQIRADRACIGCGFNLFGQPVTKEEHYDLAITRCPECGTVAALQNYPTMSHWVNRFKMILAAFWVVLLLGAFIGNSAMMMGFSIGATDEASDKLANIIGLAQEEWTKAEEAQATAVATGITPQTTTLASGTTIVTTNGVTLINGVPIGSLISNNNSYKWTNIKPEWRESHLNATVEGAGGVMANLDKDFLILMIPATLVGLLCGVFWSVALLGTARKRVILVPLIAGMFSIGFALAITLGGGYFSWATEIAKGFYAPIIVPMVVGMQLVVISIGIFFGRKIARFVTIAALPPSGRVPLSLLWTCDGLEVPSSTTK